MNDPSGPDPLPAGDETGWAGQLRATGRAFLGYLQVRTQLFALECREASQLTGRRLVIWLLAGTLVFIGYALLLASLIDFLALGLEVRWTWPALFLALLHGAGGVAIGWYAHRKERQPLFEATLRELDKDRQWIAQNAPSQPRKRN